MPFALERFSRDSWVPENTSGSRGERTNFARAVRRTARKHNPRRTRRFLTLHSVFMRLALQITPVELSKTAIHSELGFVSPGPTVRPEIDLNGFCAAMPI